ncbi:AMP-binding protein [Qipengyuania oceanensis]|uniref:AMP-binding protein n=1 Tax=Qipengyuania oceanensis TaxID=1463597 RepID=A0A844YF27_9SPHN|nr:AMP-binding protein [Qipengyuania oceanensis]MXO62527.1 AMP-binding protein [Qipengyuania oceanensis]
MTGSDGGEHRPTIIGIRKCNSPAFVRAVFEACSKGQLFAVLDDEAALPSIAGYNRGPILEPEAGAGWSEGSLALRSEDEPAQIVFTSGTEGEPKPIVISHAALADTVERLNAIMRVDETIREYVGVPVGFSFGLGRCRAVAAAGGRFYIPQNGFDPLQIRDMLAAGSINALSAVPSLLRLLIAQPGVLQGHGASLRWLEIGSQYMNRSEKEQLKALFPNARIVQHYGLTEASRSTFLVVSDCEGEALESVGQPYGAVEIRIGEQGRIQIRGPNLAMGVLRAGQIEPMTDGEGWLTTNDNGHFHRGMLVYDGRADDVINTGGVKLDPALLETQVMQALALDGGIAISRIADDRRGDGIFVALSHEVAGEQDAVEDALRDMLTRRGISPGSSLKLQVVDRIPRTATGKVQRRQLSELYAPQEHSRERETRTDDGIRSLFAQTFRRDSVPDEASFQDLGGDSLNYVEMSIALESRLGSLPANWDVMPLGKLAEFADGPTRAPATMETGIVLRALAITCVVATHSGISLVRGGTFLLFFLIGYNLARFKAPALREGRIFGSLANYARTLVIPYFLLAAVFMIYRGEFQLDTLLLYTNLTELRLTQIFPFWFVQVLVQCLVLTGLLFAIPAARQWAKRSPWAFAFGTTAALVLVWWAAQIAWNTDHLRNLVPQRYLALLWLGWCCYAADTQPRKLLALGLGVAFALVDGGVSRTTGWIGVGLVATLFVPMISVPRLLRPAVQYVSSATFTIFALNGVLAWSVMLVSDKLFGRSFSLLTFVLAFGGCLLVYEAMRRASLLRSAAPQALRPPGRPRRSGFGPVAEPVSRGSVR